ncbi:MAG: transposase zinc-binding domain-containing protein [Caldilineaceae bacterium]|nr:transposase zinc-binding domain-containing protein [Caldilineaceae bacterium]
MVLASEVSAAAPKPVWEVADVFRRHFDDYLKQHHCTAQEFKAVNAILRCRTAAMGGYIRLCDTCGNVEVAYCSCKNRHCPKCGHFEKAQWVAKQEARLLPTPHFQVVFTVDHGINDIARINPKAIYNLLFRVAGKLLKEYGRRYLGGDTGATMVPHTWGQTLQHHIHLHCMVPAGALVKTSEGYRWQESGKTFLMPVVALSEEFRDAFCNGVLKLYGQGELRPAGSGSESEVEETVRKMRARKWEVYVRASAEIAVNAAPLVSVERDACMSVGLAGLPGQRGGISASGCWNRADFGDVAAFIGVFTRPRGALDRCSDRTVIDSRHTLSGRRTPQSP